MEMGRPQSKNVRQQVDKNNNRMSISSGKEVERQTANKMEGQLCTTERTALAQVRNREQYRLETEGYILQWMGTTL
ncbi:hypothetical protein PoB_000593500 [Plakobranchus ocellatus]|uniref:Uncharacterized protein n=1 Tax=Plakobranchus ocellatus TaxID=259542 RepID=A0AAV3Y8I4_9GAST|nr:hypothetical protein PoB_000593500 [Plakobranchus ocellatus]